MPHPDQGRGIASGPRPDVEHIAGYGREQMQNRAVHVDETNALVLSRERVRVLGGTFTPGTEERE
jgi:hypothetical protein